VTTGLFVTHPVIRSVTVVARQRLVRHLVVDRRTVVEPDLQIT